MSDTIPEINGKDYTPGALMADLMTGAVAVPVWIRFGRTRHKVTAENRIGVQHGLLMALEMRYTE